MNSDTDNRHTPPKLADWLLQRFLKEDLAEEVQGDLEEKYTKLVEQRSAPRAKLNYWYQVFNYLRPFAIKNYRSNSNFIEMNIYNIKIAFRQFLKHKSTFLINVFGLTVGLASALLISLWVLNELSVDQFHKNGDNLYKVMINHHESGAISTGAETPALMADALEEEVPEVKNAILDTDPDWFGDQFIVGSTDESFKVRGKFAESDFF